VELIGIEPTTLAPAAPRSSRIERHFFLLRMEVWS
jgi:hypothetical protein